MSVGDVIAVSELLVKTVRGAVASWTQRKKNQEILGELHEWMRQLQTNSQELRNKLVSETNSFTTRTHVSAFLGAFLKDLTDACVEAEQIIPERNPILETFKAQDIKERIKELRERVMNAFQTRLVWLTANMIIDVMNVVKEGNNELKSLLKEVLPSASNAKVRELRQEIERMGSNCAEGSTDDSKFFSDVLQQISDIERDRKNSNEVALSDPITHELMCDPVKASDGYTYDRWTILGFDGRTHRETLLRSPFAGDDLDRPFSILVDDMDMRRWIMSAFPEQEIKWKEMREAYRRDALEEAAKGHLAVSEEMLDFVLQWAPKDEECERARDAVSKQLLALRNPLQEQELSTRNHRGREPDILLSTAVEEGEGSGDGMSVADVVAASELLMKTVKQAVENWEKRKKSKEIVVELNEWLDQIISNTLELCRKKMVEQPESSFTFLGSLVKDLNDSRIEAQKIIPILKIPVRHENANDVRERIKKLRKRVTNAFQTQLLCLTLYLTIGEHIDVVGAVKEGKNIDVESLLDGLMESSTCPDEKVVEVRQKIERMRSVDGMHESEFLNNVLLRINDIEHARKKSKEVAFSDPITRELMCDPVKASDGFTYDRWTILGFDGTKHSEALRKSPFADQVSPDQLFTIIIDDIDVRRRIMSQFPAQEKKCKAMREAYRRDALEEARRSRGHLTIAEEMLACVLQWAPKDEECMRERDAVSKELLARKHQLQRQVVSTIAIPRQHRASEIRSRTTIYGEDSRKRLKEPLFRFHFLPNSVKFWNPRKTTPEKIPHSDAITSVYGPISFSYAQLRVATNNFDESSLLGRGGSGSVYRGRLKDGTFIAVKHISRNSVQGTEEFMSELNIISNVRHRNVVRLQGWCMDRGGKELFLVYEYLCNGSVDGILFNDARCQELTWERRYGIAIGLGSALQYLHEGCENVYIHRDVKPSNVLLDANFVAKLGDFGLSRQRSQGEDEYTTMIAGTLGYLAPDIIMAGRLNVASDIYSFGVVLEELATGIRRITRVIQEADGTGGTGLMELYSQDRLVEAADMRLGGEFKTNEMERMLVVALACTQLEPGSRPSARDALRYLGGSSPLPTLELSSQGN